MRQLLPAYAEDVDLAAAYAYPEARPWVRANMVSSLDGSATFGGRSSGLSGPADQEVFAALRALADVVLVGAGTARIEGYRAPRPKPRFAGLRADLGLSPAPRLALVSASLGLDPAGPLFDGAQPTIVLTTETAPADRRARLAAVADVVTAGEVAVDAEAAVGALHARGLDRILCEGGPSLLGALLTAGRVDELCLTVSPVTVGGDSLRITQGPAHHHDFALAGLVEADGALFVRYVRG